MEKKNKTVSLDTIEFKATKISFSGTSYILPVEGEDYMVFKTSDYSKNFMYNTTQIKAYVRGEFHDILPEKWLIIDKEEYMEIEYYEEPEIKD